MQLQTLLPSTIPVKNSVFSELLEPQGFSDDESFISAKDIDGFLSSLPSLNTINHAIAKKVPVFTQKEMVLITHVKNMTQNRRRVQILFLRFGYHSSFYQAFMKNKFIGVYYDDNLKSIGVDVQDHEALAWLEKYIHRYFQVVINLTTHQFRYSESRPLLSSSFKSVSDKISPVTIWLNLIEEQVQRLMPTKLTTKKIEIHNGDRFIVMPENFFLVSYMDMLIIKHENEKGSINYIIFDSLNPENSKLYKGVRNKDITVAISRYMDACNYHKTEPYTVKESKRSN